MIAILMGTSVTVYVWGAASGRELSHGAVERKDRRVRRHHPEDVPIGCGPRWARHESETDRAVRGGVGRRAPVLLFASIFWICFSVLDPKMFETVQNCSKSFSIV